MLASRPGGALYVGVTNDLLRRVTEHKQGLAQGQTKRYKIDKLVYFEQYADVRDAIQREKNMKHWPRAYKTRLIGQTADRSCGRVELIAATTTNTGLKIESALDTRTYEKGIKVSKAEMNRLDIRGDTFHPEWNYTIMPRTSKS